MELSGNFWDYAVAFWSGVLLSFTPCVYPVIPLTASYIAAANTRGTRWMGFVLSLIYVFGLAVTYCCLAVVAALTGRFFGQIQSQPAVQILAANILVVFALVMLDVVRLPNGGIGIQGRIRPTNVVTVLLFGMASGLVVSPCVAPVLATLLLYTASKQNVIHSAVLLFLFSYGVGASLILVGTFSGFTSRLPKSGPWLMRVKQLCALILIAAAEYLLIKAGRLM